MDLLQHFGLGLVKDAGAAVFQKRYGETWAYRKTLGNEVVDLSDISIHKIVNGVANVVGQSMEKSYLEHEVAQAQRTLTGIQEFLSEEYPCLCKSDDDKHFLDLQLSGYEQRLHLEVLCPLSHGSIEFRTLCLRAWMLAAAVHLSILQERSHLMPDSHGREENLTSHMRKYATYAERTYCEGLQWRMAQISKVTEEHRLFGSLRKQTFRFRDSIAGNGTQPLIARMPSEEPFEHSLERRESGLDDLLWAQEKADKSRDLYCRELGRNFEATLGRKAMLKTFELWQSQSPGVIAFKPRPMGGGPKNEHSLQLTDVRFKVIKEASKFLAQKKERMEKQGFMFGYSAYGEIDFSGEDESMAVKPDYNDRIVTIPHTVRNDVVHLRHPLWFHFSPIDLSKLASGECSGTVYLDLAYLKGEGASWTPFMRLYFAADEVFIISDGTLTAKVGPYCPEAYRLYREILSTEEEEITEEEECFSCQIADLV